MRPDELRLFASQWRNVAGAANGLTEYMRGAGLHGCELLHAETVAKHAQACADRLEEQANEAEALAASAPSGGGS